MTSKALSETMLEAIKSRRSARCFDDSKPVHVESIQRMIEAAHHAPSSYNEQPWRFIICNTHQDYESWSLAFNALVSRNQEWACRAPVLIAVCCQQVFSHDQSKNHHAEHDAGLATMNLCLQAHAEGLQTNIMAGFEVLKIKAALNIPKDLKPLTMIAVGYRGTPDYLPERLKEIELNYKKTRKDIKYCFFHQKWVEVE